MPDNEQLPLFESPEDEPPGQMRVDMTDELLVVQRLRVKACRPAAGFSVELVELREDSETPPTE